MKCDQLILGRIVTFDVDDIEREYVEAMAVKDGKIIYLGSKELADHLCDENTKILDYGQHVVYPGFVDAHCHGLMAGVRLKYECDLTPGKCMQDYCDIMKKYIEDNPGRDYYSGAGWQPFEEPLASMLDEICPDKALYLTSYDAHSLWLNSKALEECGYDAAKAKQMGSIIDVDENGNPSGLVHEQAAQYARTIHKYSIEELKQGLLAWQNFAFGQGLTGVGEAMLDMYNGGYEAYKQLDAEGKWKLRTYAYPTLPEYVLSGDYKGATERIKEMKGTDSDHFQVAGYKIMLDGVIEGHTAYMDEPYLDQPECHGMLYIPEQEKLDELVLAMNEAGIPCHTHAMGDGATRIIMNAYEKAENKTCNFDIRNSVCHLQCVHKEDIKRFADYNVIAVVAPLWAPIEKANYEKELKYIGEKRVRDEYPIASFTKTGVSICFHSDYPVSPDINPALSIYCAEKRGMPNDIPSSIRNADEGITSLQSLFASTCNCAALWHKETELGTFAIGKRADATVFDKDFLINQDLAEVANIKLIATIIDGEEVYKAK